MTAFPIFYAVIENDLRRVLAYSLNNQLGFMVVGIGIGTELALNGAVGPRLLPHPLQGAAVHVDGRGAATAPARSRARSSAGSTSRCR